MSVMSVFGLYMVTYPVVYSGPDAVKLNVWVVELKANSVMVELEFSENIVCSE